MKYAPHLLAALSLVFGIPGFLMFADAAAIVFRFLAVGLLVTAVLIALRRRRIKKPVPSSFAATFNSEVQPP